MLLYIQGMYKINIGKLSWPKDVICPKTLAKKMVLSHISIVVSQFI